MTFVVVVGLIVIFLVAIGATVFSCLPNKAYAQFEAETEKRKQASVKGNLSALEDKKKGSS